MSRSLFATRLYETQIDDAALLVELAHSIRTLSQDDEAGRRWSRDKGYKGYTSFAYSSTTAQLVLGLLCALGLILLSFRRGPIRGRYSNWQRMIR